MRRIALAALLVTSVATAKTDIGTDENPESGPSDPVAVRAKLDGTSARIVADYRIRTGIAADMTHLELTMPFGAVVTGATITHAGVARRMTLEGSESVERKFEAAFGDESNTAKPTTWVVKLTASVPYDGSYGVSVMIGAPIVTELGITLEVLAPTCFHRDRRYVRAPIGWEKAARAKRPSASVIASCVPVSTMGEDAWISFAAPQAARRPSGDRLSATTARLAVDSALHLARTELALAENLADMPRDLATVILVDESRSMSDHQRRSQREIVLGYLRAAPNSRIQVLAFSRTTRPLLPAWTVASRARARLERELASMKPRNGSSFDTGLVEAARMLSTIKGTHRVLIVTDELMASRLSSQPAELAQLVPPGTIINVAVTTDFGEIDEEGNAILARHDQARLALLAAATTGIATSLGEIDSSRRIAIDAAMLVRPTSIDHVRATGLGWAELDSSVRERLGGENCTDSIRAGGSCVWWTRGTKFAGPIQLEGLMWNQRVVRLVRPLADPGHTIAREIVSTGTVIPEDDDPNTFDGEGDERLSARIDALAHAVTPTTALFVRWGGDILFAGGFVSSGLGGFGRSGTTGGIRGIGGLRHPTVQIVDLAPQLRPLVAHCKLGTKRAVVSLEITLQEIVHIDVVVSPAPGDPGDAERRCIEEATWDFTPTLPTLEPFRTVRVVL